MPYDGGSYCLASQGSLMLYGGGSFQYCEGSWRPGLHSLVLHCFDLCTVYIDRII